ncbi:MAG: metal-dependent hydrolase [Ktedonobacteraceae bacterium]|nr:metal-dependent hydrolase [Ktedonobacteraceae bacterium]
MTTELNGTQITWFGHATFKITSPQGKVILIDPWLTDNPSCPPELKRVDKVDLLLVTHGHFDHTGDLLAVAKQHQPTTVAVMELAGWLGSKGVKTAIDLNIGGSETFEGITVSATQALHTSSLPGENVYVGVPIGFVIRLENGLTIYHAGDTTVFSDMQLIRELYAPDIAVLPIGDHYTMGPKAAALAVRLLGVKQVIPMHYGTFPLLTGTPAALREELGRIGLSDVEVVAMTPGQTIK